jgi:hypothetical protein
VPQLLQSSLLTRSIVVLWCGCVMNTSRGAYRHCAVRCVFVSCRALSQLTPPIPREIIVGVFAEQGKVAHEVSVASLIHRCRAAAARTYVCCPTALPCPTR